MYDFGYPQFAQLVLDRDIGVRVRIFSYESNTDVLAGFELGTTHQAYLQELTPRLWGHNDEVADRECTLAIRTRLVGWGRQKTASFGTSQNSWIFPS